MPATTRSKTTGSNEPSCATGPPKKPPSSRKGPDIPPTYTINLSLPPSQRYIELAQTYKSEITDLISLFDEVCADFLTIPGLSFLSISTIKQLARIFLRRVHDDEQTTELRGISEATGVEMFLLVAFNVLLDLFMGCTSGGVRVHSRSSEGRSGKMVHFRTLDWGMDVLRRVVVCLDFVEREGGDIVASTVTYVGFVGVLTGVRQDLSVSLNFRGLHNHSNSWLANMQYWGHQGLVLLGRRPSIASTLRKMILPGENEISSWKWLSQRLVSTTTTSCYLIFCNGNETLIIEKDRVSGELQSSKDFVSAANHDVSHEQESVREAQGSSKAKSSEITGIEEIISESIDRKGCLDTCFQDALTSSKHQNGEAVVEMRDVERWLQTYPILNECTHYAVIMDPESGSITWMRRWIKPYRCRE
jgi:beta subunit of N-acylethanolamine-hydrolyzing acid amidase